MEAHYEVAGNYAIYQWYSLARDVRNGMNKPPDDGPGKRLILTDPE